jgi:hypothetical protein
MKNERLSEISGRFLLEVGSEEMLGLKATSECCGIIVILDVGICLDYQ